MTFLLIAPKLAILVFLAGTALFASRHPSDAARPFLARIFNPYRPELHYMRGPGPACRAKQAALSAAVQSMVQEIRVAKAR
jgi:hypothetical protein